MVKNSNDDAETKKGNIFIILTDMDLRIAKIMMILDRKKK
jgi:hypothetical protein